MPVQIMINGENATQAIEEFATLSAAFGGRTSAPVSAVVEETKPKQRKSAPAKEPEGKVIDLDKIEKEIEEENGAAQEDVEIPSVVDLRTRAQEVGQDPKKKPKIKALLNEFESASISDVPEDKRAAFMAKLEKL
ncbi:hypothetical protein [Fontibacillus sp. BL9]|uniref:hypothetical protein n=1 Tax=Fontibacillus sp. BL9 TaxID=3389971 RepID=UPI00397DFA84